MTYESFSLRLDPGSGGAYAVCVQSPGGEGRGTFRVPRVEANPSARSDAGSDRTGARRNLSLAGSAPEVSVLEVGRELFRALFRDEVAKLFYSSLGRLPGRHRGLRIHLTIDPRCAELAPLQALPWEWLCRPETEDFLCLSRRTPVVRVLEAHRERRPAMALPRRLRVLVVGASPVERPELNLATEHAHLEGAWRGLEKRVDLVFLEGKGVEEIRKALLAAPFHVLHFMGHGEFDEESGQGSLLFDRGDGTGQLFEGRRLAGLLQDCETLRLVVLNACHTAEAVGHVGAVPFSGVASALAMSGVPAVVAMNGPVSDRAAVAFSRIFYQRLAAGDPIEAAVTEGRLAIQRVEPEEGAWATPILFLRHPEEMLFAPRSTVRVRRAALLGGLGLLLLLVSILAAGWLRERRSADVMRLTHEGIGLLELGRKAAARMALQNALDVEPTNSAVLGNLAFVEIQLGDDEAALLHLQDAVQAAPEEAVHHYNLGNLLARRKRNEEALACLRRAVELDPDYLSAYNELANVYLDLEHPAEARKALEAGLARDPTVAKLHKNLARVALAQGRPEDAIRHLERALALYPPADPAGKGEALYWLAAAAGEAGRPAQVCAALQGLKVLDPLGLSPFAKDATTLAGEHRCLS